MGKFVLTQMAAIAELEGGMISQRTKAALAAAKERGQLLGAARPGAWDGKEERRKELLAQGRETIRKRADQHASRRCEPRAPVTGRSPTT